jgi:hypothetical protein
MTSEDVQMVSGTLWSDYIMWITYVLSPHLHH